MNSRQCFCVTGINDVMLNGACVLTYMYILVIGEVIRPDLSNSGQFKRQTASEIAI